MRMDEQTQTSILAPNRHAARKDSLVRVEAAISKNPHLRRVWLEGVSLLIPSRLMGWAVYRDSSDKWEHVQSHRGLQEMRRLAEIGKRHEENSRKHVRPTRKIGWDDTDYGY